jgi:hypothetical protein
MKRPPDQLPDRWLFDSEALLRELGRCRELVLQIPATTHATHFAANIAISAIWSLREHIRFLLSLHREGQRQFARKHAQTSVPTPNRNRRQTAPRAVKPREFASPGQVA